MFSMFGRTGAPTKTGPQKRSGIFCNSNMPEIMGDMNKSDSDDQKRSPVFQQKINRPMGDTAELTADRR